MKYLFLIIACLGLTIAASANKKMDDKMNMMDTNKDGKIDAQEHASGAGNMFTSMDTNKDGKVDVKEMEAMKMHKGKDHYKMSAKDKIAKMDTNGDGMLDSTEHTSGASKMFTEMDTNQDGSVDVAEMKAGHKKKMK